MSTNKTENYGLHAWVAGDDFLREEINENFALLDGAVEECQVVVGTYMGTGGSTTQTITLGFRPKAVLSLTNRVAHSSSSSGRNRATLALDGANVDGYLTITDTGFQVSNALNVSSQDDYNRDSYPYNPYRYIVWK